MKMRINHKILSIPPHISTSWEQIVSLKTEKIDEFFFLHVVLKSGSIVTVPGLDVSIVDAIFLAHSKHLELTSSSLPPPLTLPNPSTEFVKLFEPSSPLSCAEFRGLTSVLQHDPELSKSPNFPKEILYKISLVSASLGIKDPRILPREEPHCNCPHCQIVRSMKESIESSLRDPHDEDNEEEVSDADLCFKSWIIYPEKEKIYKIIHPDHREESYLVDLESPVSCSCGVKHCEHIKAVLNS